MLIKITKKINFNLFYNGKSAYMNLKLYFCA